MYLMLFFGFQTWLTGCTWEKDNCHIAQMTTKTHVKLNNREAVFCFCNWPSEMDPYSQSRKRGHCLTVDEVFYKGASKQSDRVPTLYDCLGSYDRGLRLELHMN